MVQQDRRPLTSSDISKNEIKYSMLQGKNMDIQYKGKDHIPLESPFLYMYDRVKEAKQKEFAIMYVSINGDNDENANKFYDTIKTIEEASQEEIKRQGPKVGPVVTFKTIVTHQKDNTDLFYRLVINKKDSDLFVDEAYRPFDYSKLTTKHLVKFILVINGVYYEPETKIMGLEFEIHRIMVKQPSKKKKSVRYVFNDISKEDNHHLVETEFPQLVEEEIEEEIVKKLNHHETENDNSKVNKALSTLDEIEINLSDVDD